MLEQRKMMTVSAVSSDSFGKLSVACNDAADNITVYQSGVNVLVKSTNPTGAVTTWNMGSAIRSMEIRTAGGDDMVTNNTNLPSNIYGGSGNDFMAYTTVVNGATNMDIAQRGANNCFILASMVAVASRGVDIGSRITYSGNGNYNVALFRKTGSVYTATSVSMQSGGAGCTPKLSFQRARNRSHVGYSQFDR